MTAKKLGRSDCTETIFLLLLRMLILEAASIFWNWKAILIAAWSIMKLWDFIFPIVSGYLNLGTLLKIGIQYKRNLCIHVHVCWAHFEIDNDSGHCKWKFVVFYVTNFFLYEQGNCFEKGKLLFSSAAKIYGLQGNNWMDRGVVSIRYSYIHVHNWFHFHRYRNVASKMDLKI